MKKLDIKYSKDLLWLKPFVECLDVLPLKKLQRIKGYRVAKNLDSQSYGSIVTKDGKKYSINIETYTYSKKDKQYRKKRIEEILLTLAHELAHLVHWEHTPQHFQLQSNIMWCFSLTLHELKIKDHSQYID